MGFTVSSDQDLVVHPEEFFIGGEWVRATNPDQRADVVNPSTEELIGNLADPGPADADLAVVAARRAFDSGAWSSLDVAERIERVGRFVTAVQERMPAINRAWSAEAGATVGWARNVHEIGFPLIAGMALDLAATFPLSVVRPSQFGDALIEYEPYGVVVAITTYNGPLSYLGVKVLPALLAGNAVIMKTPPQSRLLAQHVAEAALAADLPPGVLSILTSGPETSRHLVEHPGVDLVTFTGGVPTGSQILHSTADRIGKVVLELGGKSAGIIADDIPVDELVPMVMGGLVPYQGQVCAALTRLLVSRTRHDEVEEALVAALESVTIGDVRFPETDFGPVAIERTRDRCEQYTAQAVADGAVVATGGKRPAHLDRGWFYEPTLLTNVTNDMAVAQEEVFGPVFTLIEYDDIDDAVAIANDSIYGLSGAIFTHDDDLALAVARRVRVGTFMQNAAGGVMGHAFGGFKRSGLGREMGLDGYLEFLQSKSIGLAARDRVDIIKAD